MRTSTQSTNRPFATLLALGFTASTAAGVFAADAASSPTPADAPSQRELLDRINALQSQVTELRNQQAQQSKQVEQTLEQKLAAQRAVDATIKDVRHDAEQRSQLFGLGDNQIVAGHTESGFKFHTADGNFSLNPWLQLQFRYDTTNRSDGKSARVDDTQSGFEVRRLKFGADGNLYGPDLTYFFQGAIDRHTGNAQLELAWAKYHFEGTPLSIQAGQIKDPLDHEQISSARYFGPAERSLVDDVFAKGEGFVQGVTLVYDNGGPLRGAAAFTDGLGNFNTNFEQYPNTGIPTDWGTAVRAEFKFFGDWKDYDTHFSAYGTKEDTLVAGIGADYTEAGRTATLTHVLDAEFLTRSGWLLYGGYLGRYTKDNTVGTGAKAAVNDTYDETLRLTASYALDQHWEPYLQYEFIHFDPNSLAAKSQDEVHVIRAGTSYYLHGHNAKFQADVSYLPNGSPVNDDGSGVLLDNGHSEIIFRAQFQLLL